MVSMARCKNVGGVPSDGDGCPPRLTEVAQEKCKKVITKKIKRIEAEVAQAVAEATDHTKRGGKGSGIQIGEHRFHLEG
jgi:hypothetical protein